MDDLQTNLPTGKPRCQTGNVYSTNGWLPRQCSRAATVGNFCKQHSPEAQKKQHDKQSEKYRQQNRASQVQWYGPKFLAVLREIEAGHSDPSQVARDIIDKYEKTQK